MKSLINRIKILAGKDSEEKAIIPALPLKESKTEIEITGYEVLELIYRLSAYAQNTLDPAKNNLGVPELVKVFNRYSHTRGLIFNDDNLDVRGGGCRYSPRPEGSMFSFLSIEALERRLKAGSYVVKCDFPLERRAYGMQDTNINFHIGKAITGEDQRRIMSQVMELVQPYKRDFAKDAPVSFDLQYKDLYVIVNSHLDNKLDWPDHLMNIVFHVGTEVYYKEEPHSGRIIAYKFRTVSGNKPDIDPTWMGQDMPMLQAKY